MAGALAAAALIVCAGSAAAGGRGVPATFFSITLQENAGQTPDSSENSGSPSTGERFAGLPLLLTLTASGLLLAALCKTQKQPQES
ncbi:MAG: hypothetical protein ACLSAP_10255 [Oscillospiraceae bacterium]